MLNHLINTLKFKSGIWFYSLVIAIINISILNFPLIGILGYEFSAVNGLLLSILSGFYTLKTTSKPEYKFKELVMLLFILWSIPLAISIINSFFTMFCSFWDGIAFYILISGVSILFGATLAYLITILFKRFKRTLFLLSLFIFALIPIVEIYFLPQVYFYSPIIGYFPGNIYDEALSPDLKLLLHQIIVVLISVIILILINKFQAVIGKRKFAFMVSLIIVFITGQYLSQFLGFSTTYSLLEKKLSGKFITEKFQIHFDKLSDKEIRYLATSTEYYYQKLKESLKIIPSKKINIYLFEDRNQKKELFGAGNADVAKPWQYSVYLSKDSWENTLFHELVHVFSVEFGTGLFKLASGFNPALIEGIAEAVEGTSYELELLDFAALAFNNNYVLQITPLFSGLNFFKSNSSLGYTYSGAFIKYLISKYGIKKVKEFYASNDFEKIFQSRLVDEERLFKDLLGNRIPIGEREMADYYFGRLSIVQKVCPRYISDRLNKAYKLLSTDNLDDAETLFLEVNKKTTNYSALLGLSEVYYKKDRNEDAIKLILDNMEPFVYSPYEYPLMLRFADLNALNDINSIAELNYNNIIESNTAFDLISVAKVRLKLLKYKMLKEYILGDDSLKYNILIKMHNDSLDYDLIPAILGLADRLSINYKDLIKKINKTFIIDNLESSYAIYKLSVYMLSNGDYINARKYAALALRYKTQNPFYYTMQEHFEKTNWFNNNGSNILNATYPD